MGWEAVLVAVVTALPATIAAVTAALIAFRTGREVRKDVSATNALSHRQSQLKADVLEALRQLMMRVQANGFAHPPPADPEPPPPADPEPPQAAGPGL